MKAEIPPDVQNEVACLAELLRSLVARSSLSRTEIESGLGLAAGSLDAILSGPAELEVAHFFGIWNMTVAGRSAWA